MVKNTNDYQALNDELEQILITLQSGALTIDEALPAYEQGIKLVTLMETKLSQAQNHVTQLQAAVQN